MTPYLSSGNGRQFHFFFVSRPRNVYRSKCLSTLESVEDVQKINYSTIKHANCTHSRCAIDSRKYSYQIHKCTSRDKHILNKLLFEMNIEPTKNVKLYFAKESAFSNASD